MRILTLAGKNLASLRDEFTIHFDREPLASAGLFAITGATGAGKSTLLDAICLPLYNQIPRLNGTREQGKIVEQVGNSTVSANDPRQILRRGAGEGYASVRFQTAEGAIYTARWEVWRAGKRPNGALQTERLTLIDAADHLIADSTKRSKEYLLLLQKLIGLSFEQFTSAILLAQGDFAAFLEAKSDEKSTLLELLTHTEHFSQISTVIFKRYNDLRNERERVREQIEQLGCLTEEQRGELEQKLTANEAQGKLLDEELIVLRTAIEWHANATKLVSELRAAEETMASKRRAMQSLDEKHSWVKPWKESQAIRKILEENVLIEEKLKGLALQQEGAQKELMHLDARLQGLEVKSVALQEKHVALERERTELDHALREIEDLDALLKKSGEERGKSEEKCTSIKAEGVKVAELLKQQVKSVEILDKKLIDRNQIITALSPYKDLYALQGTLVAEVGKLCQDFSAIGKAQEEYIAHSASYQTHLQRQQEIEEKLKTLAGCDSIEVITLRAHLYEGEPCPVCGSTSHLYHTREAVVSGKSLEELEAETMVLTKALEATKAELEKSKEAIIRAQTTQNDKQEDFDKSRLLLVEILSPYRAKLPSVESLKEIHTLAANEWKMKAGSCLQQLHEELRQVEAECKQWYEQEKLANLEGELAQARALSRTYTEQREQLLGRYKEEDERKKAYELEFNKHKERRDSLTQGKTTDQLQQVFKQKEANLEQEKVANLDALRGLKEEKEQKANAYAQTEGQVKELRLRKAALNDVIADWEVHHPEYTQQVLEALNQHSAEEVEQYTKEREHEEQEIQRLQGVIEERRKQKEEHEQQKPTRAAKMPEELRQEQDLCVNQKSALDEEGQKLRLQKIADEKNRERRAELQANLEEGKVLFEQWEELNALFGSNNGRKFREIAQGYTLQDLITYANRQLQHIMPRYRLERSELSQKDRSLLVLNIVDTQMMGAQRNVDTLSGGEKFIVSLALSLALSSISAHSNTIEMLFIDEGFGTLDPNHLRMVLEALEHLEQQGRRIGLISHVAELNESIPVQIHVEKIDGDSSRVVVLDRR